MPVNLLMIEFLDWLARRPRTYAETMEAWRTSCPRQSVWEDAQIEGLTAIERGVTHDQSRVVLTAHGRAALESTKRTHRGPLKADVSPMRYSL